MWRHGHLGGREGGREGGINEGREEGTWLKLVCAWDTHTHTHTVTPPVSVPDGSNTSPDRDTERVMTCLSNVTFTK